MPVNPDDPRIRKTRRSLQAAFMRLILQKGYDAISIQDIADEAETARVTFYRHYKDKEELLTDSLNTLYEDLVKKTQRISAEGVRQGYSPLSVLYEHIEEQEGLYRILFSSRGTQVVIERMRHHMAERALETIRATVPAENILVPAELVAQHLASTGLGMAIWWLEHDKPYPAQYMAQISLWLGLSGTLRALSIPVQPPIPEL